jgi:hypothetical protein
MLIVQPLYFLAIIPHFIRSLVYIVNDPEGKVPGSFVGVISQVTLKDGKHLPVACQSQYVNNTLYNAVIVMSLLEKLDKPILSAY